MWDSAALLMSVCADITITMMRTRRAVYLLVCTMRCKCVHDNNNDGTAVGSVRTGVHDNNDDAVSSVCAGVHN